MTDRIFALIQDNDINGVVLAKAIGLNKGAVSEWKTGRNKPSAEAIVKIADYFGTSTDYLLGRTDIKEPSNHKEPVNAPDKKNQSELAILEKLRTLPPEKQKVVEALLNQL